MSGICSRPVKTLREDDLPAFSQFRQVRLAPGTPLAPISWHRERKLWPRAVVPVASPLPASPLSCISACRQYLRASPVLHHSLLNTSQPIYMQQGLVGTPESYYKKCSSTERR